VKSNDEEQKAIATARRIPGVRDVKSELKVGGN
jgi:osmotically-inducible protein OsmY